MAPSLRSSFTIAVRTLDAMTHGGDGDMEWRSGVPIEAHELLASSGAWPLEGYCAAVPSGEYGQCQHQYIHHLLCVKGEAIK